MARRYWFARVYPLSDPRKSLIPIAWQGWVVTAVFMFGALFSVASAFMLYDAGYGWWALLTTPVIFIVSAFFYVTAVATTGDIERTALEHRERRKSGNPI